MPTVDLRLGDCLDVLRTMADCSVDAVVTDPPYELGFMGRAWDSSGIAYSVDLWREACRVLKPGGHLLAFGGTRTSHRMVCAIEDAGFTIRDSIAWIYGQGFPKSLDIGKAIDAAAGAERAVIGMNPTYRQMQVAPSAYNLSRNPHITAPATDAARQWDGWGTALKPAVETVCMARKPIIGTVAANVQAWGTGGLNINACRIGTTSKKWDSPRGGIWRTDPAARAEMVDTCQGRWPANLVLSCCGEDPHAEGCPVAELDAQSGYSGSTSRKEAVRPRNGGWVNSSPGGGVAAIDSYGDSGGASRFFYVAKPSRAERDRGLGHLPLTSATDMVDRTEGSAGMDSPRAGAGRTGGGRNTHPTVKPISLMKHLVALVTPPGGTVLDLFCGSGTTGCACAALGFDFIGVDQDPAYLEIARLRIDAASPRQSALREAM